MVHGLVLSSQTERTTSMHGLYSYVAGLADRAEQNEQTNFQAPERTDESGEVTPSLQLVT